MLKVESLEKRLGLGLAKSRSRSRIVTKIRGLRLVSLEELQLRSRLHFWQCHQNMPTRLRTNTANKRVIRLPMSTQRKHRSLWFYVSLISLRPRSNYRARFDLGGALTPDVGIILIPVIALVSFYAVHQSSSGFNTGRVGFLDRHLVRPSRHFLPTHVHVRYMLSPVRLSSVCLSSVTLVHCTEVGKIFGNISTAFDSTLAIHWHRRKILRRSSQGNPSVTTGVAKYIDFGPIERYISETVQDRS